MGTALVPASVGPRTTQRLRTGPLRLVPSARSHHPLRCRGVDVCETEASLFTAQARRAERARAPPREG